MIKNKKHIKSRLIIKQIPAFFLAFVILLLNSLHLYSQGGSNYSIFGIGDIETSPGAAYESLAGTSIAFPTEHSINSLNPAIWSKLPKTRLMTGYKFNQHLVQDEKENILFQNNGKISTLSSVFVIDTGMGIAVSLGINPYSGVNYLIESPVSVSFEGIEVTGNSLYQGLGGLSMGYLGASVNVFKNLSVGASAFTTFGIIKSLITTSFNDDNFFQVSTITENKFNGYGMRFGLLYEPINGLNIGLFSEQHFKLQYEQNQIFESSFTSDTVTVKSINVALPNAYGIGLSYLLGKFRIGADIKSYQFENLDYNPGPYTKYSNLMIYSIGFSRLGNKSTGADYIDKITYNLGLGYKQLYYQVKGNQIADMFFSVGANIPIVGTSIIDASITFGNRKMVNDFLVNEFYGRLSVDISIGETWFKPIRREY